MTFQQLVKEKRYGAVYILARYFYRIGEPVLSDRAYEVIQDFIRSLDDEYYNQYLNRTYDDDPVPVKLLTILGIKPVSFVTDHERHELYEYLNEDKSFSIQSVTSYEEAYPFFKRARDFKQDIMVSLKIDGVNTKMLYVDEKFAISLSRGRAAGNSFDYTDRSAIVMPPELKTGKKMVKVVGESYVEHAALAGLREKYGKPNGYVSEKSSAISMLRVDHDLEDYADLHTRVFSADIGNTLEESFQILAENGFEVVPHFKIRWSEVPDSLTRFSSWAKENIFDRMWELGKGIPSDGIVVEVNDLHWVGSQHNQYVDRQLALKFEQWSYQIYKGIVKSVKIEQQRVYSSVRVEIEPLVTSDGNEARVINSYNPAILIRNGYYEGNIVYFERNSNACNAAVHGERLKQILGEMDGD